VRVLHLTTEFPPLIYGGLGTAVGGLVRAWVASGRDGLVLLFDSAFDTGYYGAPGRHRFGRTIRLDSLVTAISFERDFEEVLAAVAAARPDVIHLHSFWLGWQALRLREQLGIPLVYTVHSLDMAEYEIGNGPHECVGQWAHQAQVIEGADRVIALSEDERRLIGAYCPAAASKVRVVGNGIDERAIPRRRRRGGGPPVVLFSGRFVQRKGLWDFLEAIPLIEARCPGLNYVLAGGHRGSPAQDVAGWLLTPTLRAFGARIRFTGWLSAEEMADEYAAADILVVPSWYEPFGMVVLEGMLHGLAVAASAVGGPVEILGGTRAGALFPPRNPEALADCVARLGRSPGERRRMGALGARWVRRRWLWSRIVYEMGDVYSEALGGASSGSAAGFRPN